VAELALGFPGRSGGHAAFGYVLLAAAGGRHHLVVSARAGIYEAVAEFNGGVIDNLRGLIRLQFAVSAMRRDEPRFFARRRRGGALMPFPRAISHIGHRSYWLHQPYWSHRPHQSYRLFLSY